MLLVRIHHECLLAHEPQPGWYDLTIPMYFITTEHTCIPYIYKLDSNPSTSTSVICSCPSVRGNAGENFRSRAGLSCQKPSRGQQVVENGYRAFSSKPELHVAARLSCATGMYLLHSSITSGFGLWVSHSVVISSAGHPTKHREQGFIEVIYFLISYATFVPSRNIVG